jgi:hypothetical protein
MHMPLLMVANGEVQAALSYAKRGWSVFPLHSIINGRKRASWGKHPRTAHGVKEATTDPAIIQRWWSEAPQANVGIATGAASGLFMLGPDGQAGIDALAELERQYGPLPLTPQARSGNGARHYYLAWPSKASRTGLTSVACPVFTNMGQRITITPPSNIDFAICVTTPSAALRRKGQNPFLTAWETASQ